MFTYFHMHYYKQIDYKIAFLYVLKSLIIYKCLFLYTSEENKRKQTN